jgi:hypothetical protein
LNSSPLPFSFISLPRLPLIVSTGIHFSIYINVYRIFKSYAFCLVHTLQQFVLLHDLNEEIFHGLKQEEACTANSWRKRTKCLTSDSSFGIAMLSKPCFNFCKS